MIVSSLLVTVLLHGISAPVHGAGSTVYVTIYDYGFKPKIENVTTGTTVVWNNTGQQGHTVYTTGTPSFQSSSYTIQPYGQSGLHTYSVFFGQAGVYQYYCSIHPFMQGELNVTGAPVSQPSGGGPGGQPSTQASPSIDLLVYLIPILTIAVLGGLVFYNRRRRSNGKSVPEKVDS